MVRKGGLEPPPLAGPDPKSGASANSATFAQFHYKASQHASADAEQKSDTPREAGVLMSGAPSNGVARLLP